MTQANLLLNRMPYTAESSQSVDHPLRLSDDQKTYGREPMPNEVHCAHILVKTENEAKKVIERLNKGEKFSNVAKEVSICPSGKRGGDLGTFTRGKMVKEFEQAAFGLEKGQTSPIVKTQFGYHLIKRLE